MRYFKILPDLLVNPKEGCDVVQLSSPRTSEPAIRTCEGIGRRSEPCARECSQEGSAVNYRSFTPTLALLSKLCQLHVRRHTKRFTRRAQEKDPYSFHAIRYVDLPLLLSFALAGHAHEHIVSLILQVSHTFGDHQE